MPRPLTLEPDVSVSTQGLPRCPRWLSAGGEQPLLGYGGVAELPVTTGGKLLLRYSPGRWEEQEGNPVHMASADLLSSVGEHACRKGVVSPFPYHCPTPATAAITDLNHQRCRSLLNPSEESQALHYISTEMRLHLSRSHGTQPAPFHRFCLGAQSLWINSQAPRVRGKAGVAPGAAAMLLTNAHRSPSESRHRSCAGRRHATLTLHRDTHSANPRGGSSCLTTPGRNRGDTEGTGGRSERGLVSRQLRSESCFGPNPSHSR